MSISRNAESRINDTVNKWFSDRWDIVEPGMIESLKRLMREEFCHGLIEGHNIATAKAAIELKRNEETISEEQDAIEGRR